MTAVPRLNFAQGGTMVRIFLASVFFWLCSATTQLNAADFKGITLGLVSTSWDTLLPPAVAQQAGFFAQENLDVRSVTLTRGGPVMIALLTSGQAQLVIAGAVSVLQ
jgi:ABC-type nitrate/sulfonate/bicarbonate transport system substrate-binding protein